MPSATSSTAPGNTTGSASSQSPSATVKPSASASTPPPTENGVPADYASAADEDELTVLRDDLLRFYEVATPEG